MEPQLSVLLYSKYSALSKSIMNIIQTSGLDFTNKFRLQPLCIDNEEIRKRIIENKQIQVTSVPCLLLIFPDGGIEKYDGAHAFEWVEGIIRQFTPPPPPPPPQPSEEDKWRMQQTLEQQKIYEQKQLLKKQRLQESEQNRRNYEKQYEKQYEEGYDTDENLEHEHPKRTRRRIKREQVNPPERKPTRKTTKTLSGVTSIDDLPTDEDDELISDRYRSRKPVGRIRSDEGNYTKGDNLFQGERADMRGAKRSAVKGNNHTGNDAKSQKSADLMTKAKELAKGREEATPPPGHPLQQRS